MKLSCLICAILLSTCGAFAGTARILDAVTSAPPTPRLSGPIVEKTLRADPRTQNFYVSADTYQGLVILHGWVGSVRQRDTIISLVNDMPEVERVFSFIEINRDPDDLIRLTNEGVRFQVSQSNMNERTRFDFPSVGMLTGPTDLARAVKVNLDADAITGAFDIKVDGYQGLVVLHGHVPDDSAKASAERVAAAVYGVDKVFSYITVDDVRTVELVVPRNPWGVAVTLTRPELMPREYRLRPQYAKYETICPPPAP
jgi:osmotically-inducible protein OsmY